VSAIGHPGLTCHAAIIAAAPQSIVITGLAHTGMCVPDCQAAVAYYRDVLGFTVLADPGSRTSG